MKLSIITINYNNYAGLRRTIDSVVIQNWQYFEWIIVDGGSTDGSCDLIEQTVSMLKSRGWTAARFSGPDDSKIYVEVESSVANSSSNDNHSPFHRILWCTEKDNGIYNAMNKGILHSTGEYCLFLNSGDCLDNAHSLETIFKWGLTSDFECFDMIGDQGNKIIYFNKLNYTDIPAYHLIYGALPHQATFIRRELFKTIGMYDENLKIVSDWKFEITAIIFNSASYSYRPYIFTRIQPNGISTTNEALNRKERNEVLQSLFPKLVLKDYVRFRSYVAINESSYICRKLYGLLFRLAKLILKIKNK